MKMRQLSILQIVFLLISFNLQAEEGGKLEFKGKIGTTTKDSEKSSLMLFNSSSKIQPNQIL